MFLYDSTSLVKLWSFILLNNLFHFRISFYLSRWSILCFCIVNEFCWKCLVYCYQNFLFKIYPDLTSSKLNFGVTRRVPLVEQELLTLPEHLSSPPFFSGVRVTRSLVLYVWFVDRCLSFFFWPLCCLFFFDIWILIAPLVSLNSSSTQVYICYALSEVLFVSFVNKNIFLGGLFILFGLKTWMYIHNLMIKNTWDNLDLVYECAIVYKNQSSVDCEDSVM